MVRGARVLPDGFAFCGLAYAARGAAPVYLTRTTPGIAADRGSFWRAASISKIVTGQVARAVLGDALNRDVSELLGWPLRNPAFPHAPVRLRHIIGHSAGLDDAGGYLVPAGVALRDWVTRQGQAIFHARPPGAHMTYSNLGYVILAALAERVAGDSFDRLAQRIVLGPWGIEAGFNWSGLGAKARSRAVPTYRRSGAGFVPQIDHAVAASGVSGADGMEVFPSEILGEDLGVLSPQGGVRLSLEGALQIARSLRKIKADPVWTPDMGPGDYLDGLMQSYGWGLQILDTPPFYPRPLIGHFANAYGLAGGVWYDRAADLAFAYCLNGLDSGDESDALRPAERAIFDAVAQVP